MQTMCFLNKQTFRHNWRINIRLNEQTFRFKERTIFCYDLLHLLHLLQALISARGEPARRLELQVGGSHFHWPATTWALDSACELSDEVPVRCTSTHHRTNFNFSHLQLH